MKRFGMFMAVILLLLPSLSGESFALEIDIGDLIGGAPPPIDLSGPPEVFPIPGTYVYFVPDIDVDLFYYHGSWYRPYRRHWFRSDDYNGPWRFVRDVPPPLTDLPTDYRRTPGWLHRIPYSDLRHNWDRWEREKYWDRRRAEERENRGIGMALPQIHVAGRPDLLPVPGRYVYFIPDTDADIFFYRGDWYRFYRVRWFRSDDYNGPWRSVDDVPPALRDLPLDYRRIPDWLHPIPYGELRHNWERWEREKYWDRRGSERERYRDRDWQGGQQRY
jgi:hypothetical protein